tara:strand:+ start:67 stop:357 length:291 start_codon:yes stop_codon:yes gene_type:complete
MSTEIEQTILDQLNQTRVNGFPLLSYIGTKTAQFGENSCIISVGNNPKGITAVKVEYMEAHDEYRIIFFKSISVTNTLEFIQWDNFDCIAREMGVL